MDGRPYTAVLTGIRRFVEADGKRDWLHETSPAVGSGVSYLRSLMHLPSSAMVCVATALAPLAIWRDIGGYDPSLATAEDWDIWLRAARRLSFVSVPGEPLQFYRKRAGSLTTQSNLMRDFAAWRIILRKQVSLGGTSAAEVRRAVAQKRLEVADIARAQGRTRLSLANLCCSVADPAMLLRMDFYRTFVRLIRGS
jgi:hypothetical protein